MQAIAARLSGVGTRVPKFEYAVDDCVSCAPRASGAAGSDSTSPKLRASGGNDLREIASTPAFQRIGTHYASAPRLLIAKLLMRRPRAAQRSMLPQPPGESRASQQAMLDSPAVFDSHLTGLPEPVRTALLMRHVQHMSLTDIAATLNVSVEAVSEHLRQGLRAVYAGACKSD